MENDTNEEQFWADACSPTPWRIDRLTKLGEAIIKAANGMIVTKCDKDDAAEIVRCVNAMNESERNAE